MLKIKLAIGGAAVAVAMLLVVPLASSGAATDQCPPPPQSKKIGDRQVEAINCVVNKFDDLRDDVHKQAKGLVKSCFEEKALPPRDQKWTAIEKAADDHRDFARTTLYQAGPGLFGAIAGYLAGYEDAYAENHHKLLTLKAAVTHFRQGKERFATYTEKQADVGEEIGGHSCGAAKKALKDAVTHENRGVDVTEMAMSEIDEVAGRN